jgi:hypothetical protein
MRLGNGDQEANVRQAARLMSAGRARLLAIAAAVLFSTGGAGIKVEAFSAAQVSGIRSGTAAVALLVWLYFSRRRLT